MSSIKETIKAEIERRKKSLRAGICNDEAFTKNQKEEMLVASEELTRLSRFIDSLPDNDFLDESIIASKDIEEEMDRMWLNWCEDVDYLSYLSIARHFAEWGAKHLK